LSARKARTRLLQPRTAESSARASSRTSASTAPSLNRRRSVQRLRNPSPDLLLPPRRL